jgi:hypothetical protein
MSFLEWSGTEYVLKSTTLDAPKTPEFIKHLPVEISGKINEMLLRLYVYKDYCADFIDIPMDEIIKITTPEEYKTKKTEVIYKTYKKQNDIQEQKYNYLLKQYNDLQNEKNIKQEMTIISKMPDDNPQLNEETYDYQKMFIIVKPILDELFKYSKNYKKFFKMLTTNNYYIYDYRELLIKDVDQIFYNESMILMNLIISNYGISKEENLSKMILDKTLIPDRSDNGLSLWKIKQYMVKYKIHRINIFDDVDDEDTTNFREYLNELFSSVKEFQ